MTQDKIKERIQQLEQERERVRATLMAYEGALQEANFWLQNLEKENNGGEPEPSPDK
jgi:hypothetical protein